MNQRHFATYRHGGEAMKRRQFLAASAAGICIPSIARAEKNSMLRFMSDADIPVLDPHWFPGVPVRINTFAVFDTLYGMNANTEVSPQMVEGATTEDDGRRWTLTLRPGLMFHDGQPVLARDCAVSIQRWCLIRNARNSFGQALWAATDEIVAPDDRTIVFRLKKPFRLLPEALGTATGPLPAIMPERLAKPPYEPFTPVKELIGSGPYRFKADERVPGERAVYERFSAYRPRESGSPSWTSGPKVAHFERVELTIISDPSTAAAALQTGERDWWGRVDMDLVRLLRGKEGVKVAALNPFGELKGVRVNHLQPPFNNPAIRRALLGTVNQQDFISAIVGDDPTLGRSGVGCFPPASPMATNAGLEVLTGPRDLDRARQDIAAAGYKGERVVLPANSAFPEDKRCSEVGADVMKKVGLNVDFQLMDLGAWFQRILKKDPVDQGGWSCYFTWYGGNDTLDPGIHPWIRGNGVAGRPGWPTSPRLEELRDAWLDAPDLATEKKIAAEIQVQALRDVTFIPLGLTYPQTAYRSDLTGVVTSFPPVFWNVRRV
jgi:peptide/nickel transport system substrate-binding protein